MSDTSISGSLKQRGRLSPRILIVGKRGSSNVGESLEFAAGDLNLTVELKESSDAMRGSALLRRAKWHLLGRLPLRLRQFSTDVLTYCSEFRPDVLLTTGFAPINAEILRRVGDLGVKRVNFLTDDPWNVAHRSRWFFRSLTHYDYIFTPRRVNIVDLQSVSSAKVCFLRFGYDQRLFFPVQLDFEEARAVESDVMFAGGADLDRVPYIAALQQAGIRLALYGRYWDRFRETRSATRGEIDVALLRKAIVGCKVALCLVRRNNRDGHSMRSFEIPAVGAAMLAEETEDHHEIFGPEGEHVLYFRDTSDLVEKTLWLLANPAERLRLKEAVHRLILGQANRYEDRLVALLDTMAIR